MKPDEIQTGTRKKRTKTERRNPGAKKKGNQKFLSECIKTDIK